MYVTSGQPSSKYKTLHMEGLARLVRELMRTIIMKQLTMSQQQLDLIETITTHAWQLQHHYEHE